MNTFFDKVPLEGKPLPRGFVKGIRALDRAINGIGCDGGYVSWSMGVPTIIPGTSWGGVTTGGAAGQGFPWGSNYTFGITKTAADKLKVWNGKLRRWGDQVYVAADTEVTFGSDGDFYLVWRWSESSGLEIETTPRAVTSWPDESDSTYIYGVIHKVKLLSGAFTLLDAVQDGIINAPIFTVAGP